MIIPVRNSIHVLHLLSTDRCEPDSVLFLPQLLLTLVRLLDSFLRVANPFKLGLEDVLLRRLGPRELSFPGSRRQGRLPHQSLAVLGTADSASHRLNELGRPRLP